MKDSRMIQDEEIRKVVASIDMDKVAAILKRNVRDRSYRIMHTLTIMKRLRLDKRYTDMECYGSRQLVDAVRRAIREYVRDKGNDSNIVRGYDYRGWRYRSNKAIQCAKAQADRSKALKELAQKIAGDLGMDEIGTMAWTLKGFVVEMDAYGRELSVYVGRVRSNIYDMTRVVPKEGRVAEYIELKISNLIAEGELLKGD